MYICLLEWMVKRRRQGNLKTYVKKKLKSSSMPCNTITDFPSSSHPSLPYF
jgi:hypothetical protein